MRDIILFAVTFIPRDPLEEICKYSISFEKEKKKKKHVFLHEFLLWKKTVFLVVYIFAWESFVRPDRVKMFSRKACYNVSFQQKKTVRYVKVKRWIETTTWRHIYIYDFYFGTFLLPYMNYMQLIACLSTWRTVSDHKEYTLRKQFRERKFALKLGIDGGKLL